MLLTGLDLIFNEDSVLDVMRSDVMVLGLLGLGIFKFSLLRYLLDLDRGSRGPSTVTLMAFV